MGQETILMSVIGILIVVISAVFHEYAHGYVAYKLGDDTAYLMGRLTLNPIPHIDLFQSIILPLIIFIGSGGRFIFGGAKPVPINPYNFRDPAKGLMLSSLAGPTMNIILAIAGTIISIPIYYMSFDPEAASLDTVIIDIFVFANIILAVFNLIPIPPLDGSRILRYFLPHAGREFLDRLEPFGLVIIIILFLTNTINVIIYPVLTLLLNLLTKVNPHLFYALEHILRYH